MTPLLHHCSRPCSSSSTAAALGLQPTVCIHTHFNCLVHSVNTVLSVYNINAIHHRWETHTKTLAYGRQDGSDGGERTSDARVEGYAHYTAVDKQLLIGRGSIGLREESRESLPEMSQESICLNGYDQSPNLQLLFQMQSITCESATYQSLVQQHPKHYTITQLTTVWCLHLQLQRVC